MSQSNISKCQIECLSPLSEKKEVLFFVLLLLCSDKGQTLKIAAVSLPTVRAEKYSNSKTTTDQLLQLLTDQSHPDQSHPNKTDQSKPRPVRHKLPSTAENSSLDSEDDYRSGSQNVSHHQQQSF